MIRKTKETTVNVKLKINGNGRSRMNTGINFFDHMLELFSKHGAFDLDIKAKGDLHVDQHHLVEDVGITLGQSFDKALGSRKGINRAGFFAMPMDETLAILAIDIGGRPYLKCDLDFKKDRIGDLDSELVCDFFQAFCSNLKCNIQIRSFEARTDHHKAEAVFKAFGRALRMACGKDKRLKKYIPSTKGLI